MAVESLDDMDWRLLEALQRDGRASYADLGRLVGLSPSAVTERVRRLEENGVITGYRCEVDPEKLGLPIMALVRLRYPHGNYKPFRDLLPYVVAMIELDEGPMMMGNVVGCDVDEVEVGLAVEVFFEPAGDDLALPFWRPAAG